MKHLLLLLSLVMLVSNVARADSFDSDKATIKKGKSDKAAMVTLDKKTYSVPVTFANDASWSSVKDHYELSDSSASCVKSGKSAVTVAADGSLSWKKCKK